LLALYTQELLCFYAEHGDMDNALRCLAAGARLNVPDKDGQTPLVSAAIGGNRDLVRYIFVRTYVRRQTKVRRPAVGGARRCAWGLIEHVVAGDEE
jgi:ankyrin repeat protein